MIYVALTFHPNQKNPARSSGLGVWRVADTWPFERVDALRGSKPISVRYSMLILHAARAYKRGSRVDPLKIALAARQRPQTA